MLASDESPHAQRVERDAQHADDVHRQHERKVGVVAIVRESAASDKLEVDVCGARLGAVDLQQLSELTAQLEPVFLSAMSALNLEMANVVKLPIHVGNILFWQLDAYLPHRRRLEKCARHVVDHYDFGVLIFTSTTSRRSMHNESKRLQG